MEKTRKISKSLECASTHTHSMKKQTKKKEKEKRIWHKIYTTYISLQIDVKQHETMQATNPYQVVLCLLKCT